MFAAHIHKVHVLIRLRPILIPIYPMDTSVQAFYSIVQGKPLKGTFTYSQDPVYTLFVKVLKLTVKTQYIHCLLRNFY